MRDTITDLGEHVKVPKKPPVRSHKEPVSPMGEFRSIATDFDDPPRLALVRAQADQAVAEYEKLHSLANKTEEQKAQEEAAWKELLHWKSIFEIVYEHCYAPDQADQRRIELLANSMVSGDFDLRVSKISPNVMMLEIVTYAENRPVAEFIVRKRLGWYCIDSYRFCEGPGR
ncbi:hypothetical protein [Harryflintia acetispora]|uniref:hypothetical protein n=1 Tax=Harryflintia acetispora TaxID=1849041 RepID=UPI0018983A6E|nr:hypothetical protein [Harryflintia acetispora]